MRSFASLVTIVAHVFMCCVYLYVLRVRARALLK